MAKAAEATQIHQTFDIHRNLAPQITFDTHLTDCLAQFLLLGLGKIADLGIRGHPGGLADLMGSGSTDSVNMSQRHPGMFLDR